MKHSYFRQNVFSKILTAMLLLLCAASLAGCTANQPVTDQNSDLTVVTDNFAAYDWCKNVIGNNNVELILLGANGADMHSYQPVARDFAQLADCDLFVYIGGESDSWAEEAKQQTASAAASLNLLATLGDKAIEEQITEGMTADHDHSQAPENDEHIWLSLVNAMTCTNAIAEKMAEIDTTNADAYRGNANEYCEQLLQLDTQYHNTVSAAGFDTVLVADRFPFIYLVNDYSLNWYAAYPGCSAETGASFETVKFLSDKLAELKLPAVLTCENADTALAETIIKTANLPNTQILAIDSLQAVTQSDIDNGKTYIETMQNNLVELAAALN